MKPTKSSHLANVKIKDHEKSLYMNKSAQKWCIVQMALHDVREIPSIIIVLSLLVHTDGPCAKIWGTNWIVYTDFSHELHFLTTCFKHPSCKKTGKNEIHFVTFCKKKRVAYMLLTLFTEAKICTLSTPPHPFLALKNETSIDPDSENTFNSTHIPHPSSLEEKARPFSWGWW